MDDRELEKQIDARKATRRHHHEQYQAVLKKIEKQLHTISKEVSGIFENVFDFS